jgi:hypothetical protein
MKNGVFLPRSAETGSTSLPKDETVESREWAGE